MRQLQECGYEVTHDSETPEGEIAVINTCGFIGDAKEESIDVILEYIEQKENWRRLKDCWIINGRSDDLRQLLKEALKEWHYV